MLKFLFWTLLLANAGLAAYQFGYLESLLPSSREPARMERQLHPERLRLVPAPPSELAPTAPDSTAAANPATPGNETAGTPASGPSAPEGSPGQGTSAAAPVAATAVQTPAAAVACLEVGNFSAEDAQRFADQLGELGARAARRPVKEVATHMVYMPPQPSREGAEKKARELRALGIEDFFIIQDNSALRWGISLGVFKTEEGARAHLARLGQQGVRTARIGQRSVTASVVAFQFRELDAKGRERIEQAASGFGQQQVRECGAA